MRILLRKFLSVSLPLFVLVFSACVTVIGPPDLDPCDTTVTCLNGGTCEDGICDCPFPYTGSNCSDEQVPSSMLIKKIAVTRFPATKIGGHSWDDSDGPDLYVLLTKGATNGEVIYDASSVRYENAEGFFYSFTPNEDTYFSAPESGYYLQLLDFDSGSSYHDQMGVMNFSPYTPYQNYPTIIVLDNGHFDKPAFEITVEYIF